MEVIGRMLWVWALLSPAIVVIIIAIFWPRWGQTTRLVVGGVFIFIILGAVGLLSLDVARGPTPAYRTSCMNNVRQIGLAMYQYAEEHDGKFPDSFGALLKGQYLTTAKVFICPSSGHSIPEDFPGPPFDNVDLSVLKRVDEWSDYVLVRGVTPRSPRDFIVIHEKWGSHKEEGGNILFNHGHVKWHTPDDLDRMLREQHVRMRESEKNTLEKEAEDVHNDGPSIVK